MQEIMVGLFNQPLILHTLIHDLYHHRCIGCSTAQCSDWDLGPKGIFSKKGHQIQYALSGGCPASVRHAIPHCACILMCAAQVCS